MRGEVAFDCLTRILYSTDASAYCEMPFGVVYPVDEEDVIALTRIAAEHRIPIIPRAAGTSIAGQVVGAGIVADVGRHMNKILEINPEERWVRVEPGVVRDELNLALKEYGLFFSPETSTSNRCMVGGMVGNNSAGMHSIVYGSTREHLMEARVVLSDGSTALFKHYDREAVAGKIENGGLEGRIYKYLDRLLASPANRAEIEHRFPDRRLRRRNHGYALDMVRDSDGGLDLCRLLCGSEGTLAFITELKLSLDPLPARFKTVMAVHCSTLAAAFDVNLEALRAEASAVELIDRQIIELSARQMEQRANLFFVEGRPEAIVAVEMTDSDEKRLKERFDQLEIKLRTNKSCYAFPRLSAGDANRIWSLRKAGLGMLNNRADGLRPVSVVEDTAVVPERLGAYVAEFRLMMDELGLEAACYAHIGAGELHLRPILDMKSDEGRRLFREIAERTAALVLKYRGSLSGEHGDGRLRGEFIERMYGPTVYRWFVELKQSFDSAGLFNPGKITAAPPMDAKLRYMRNELLVSHKTIFAFRGGYSGCDMLAATEQCNGAADCRKKFQFGGGMCPVFRAAGLEQYSPRARANALRTALLAPDALRFANHEAISVLDSCLMCKACVKECPSSVDITRLKEEYLAQHHLRQGIPFRAWAIAHLAEVEHSFSKITHIYNALLRSGIVHRLLGFDRRRVLPEIQAQSFATWLARHPKPESEKQVYLFVDEFIAYEEPQIGIAFVELAERMGYRVELVPGMTESGRVALSLGMAKRAKKIAEKNVTALERVISEDRPLVVLEPSAWSAFRDEYRALTDRDVAYVLLFDEWYMREYVAGRLSDELFERNEINVMLHEHCHEQALAVRHFTKQMLETIPGLAVETVGEGCCGMAGAFGYKRENYELSMEIGRNSFFPAVERADRDTPILAAGASCRRQIMDGTGRQAIHPIIYMHSQLKDKI